MGPGKGRLQAPELTTNIAVSYASRVPGARTHKNAHEWRGNGRTARKRGSRPCVGKFGLGQKAVFHLCDAFVVYAYGGNEPFSTVVNPFLGVEVDGNISREWEPPSDGGLVDADLLLLRRELSIDFPNRCFALWLPFRREGLRPAPGVGFSSNFPSGSQTIAELAKPADLRVLLTALRHVESVEIREHGETWLRDPNGRGSGPTTRPEALALWRPVLWRHNQDPFRPVDGAVCRPRSDDFG
jgi:hypothetical protein